MNNRNYQKELDALIQTIDDSGTAPTLLLHACCAPCSSYVLKYLAEHFRIIVCYYNPNITDAAEFRKRAEELQRLVSELPVRYPVTVTVPDYHPEEFYEIAKGLENEPERGRRCTECFRLRLRFAARMAADCKADYFATTLTISPQKDAELLNTLGAEAEALIAESGSETRYLPSDFKKKGGYAESVQLSQIYGLYRQNYCGCVYSKRDMQQRENAEKNRGNAAEKQ